MFRSLETKAAVPMLDVCVGGVFLPRGKAVPLIVQMENARELRESGVIRNQLGERGDAPARSAA